MKLWVRGEITDSLANNFVTTLRAMREVADEADVAMWFKDITLIIDSPGGQVSAALAMASAVEAFPGRVEAVLITADSAALVPALPADTVTVARDGSYLLHESTIEIPARVQVSPAEMRKAAAATEASDRRIYRMMEKHSGERSGFWALLAAGNRRLSAEKMVELRLADEISPLPRCWLRSADLITSIVKACMEERRIKWRSQG